jgi:DNA repair exonuclease SbcCD ATPase subunit
MLKDEADAHYDEIRQLEIDMEELKTKLEWAEKDIAEWRIENYQFREMQRKALAACAFV